MEVSTRRPHKSTENFMKVCTYLLPMAYRHALPSWKSQYPFHMSSTLSSAERPTPYKLLPCCSVNNLSRLLLLRDQSCERDVIDGWTSKHIVESHTRKMLLKGRTNKYYPSKFSTLFPNCELSGPLNPHRSSYSEADWEVPSKVVITPHEMLRQGGSQVW